MNDQVNGLIRTALAGVGGFAVAKGWVSNEVWQWLLGGAFTIGPGVWSWLSNRPASMAAKVQSMPGVEVVTSASAPADVKAAVKAAK